MSFYRSILKKKDIDPQSLNYTWEISLNEQEFEELKRELKHARQWNLDPKDAALYYAVWWKRIYDGGRPSKELVFNSIERENTPDLDASEFYKKAKLGGQQLGYNWIQRQNTLYFRTLLLQGGLPLRHISSNEGHYKRFLLEVLEMQPESVEEISSRPDITSLLPISSRNNDIFQSCLDIVDAILDKDNKYDHLFEESRSLQDMVRDLKLKGDEIGRKKRIVKPKTYWVLSERNNNTSIHLQLGFADNYTAEALSKAFGVEIKAKNYQFYIDEMLICVFRRRIDGKYQTHWKDRSQIHWDGDEKIPNCFLIGNNERFNTPGFIATVPSFEKPTLWEDILDQKWRLVRGNSIRSSTGLILYPEGWECELDVESIQINNNKLLCGTFEGEVSLSKDGDIRDYKSGVNSFDWNIIGHSPNWLRKSNMPLIRQKPEIWVYNSDNEMVLSPNYDVSIRTHLNGEWSRLEDWRFLPNGCLDVKIEYEGIIAHDLIYKIGNFNIEYQDQKISHAEFELINSHGFELIMNSSDLVEVNHENQHYILNLNLNYLKVPLGVTARLKRGTEKSVLLEIDNPFQGVALVDKYGNIINENSSLYLGNLNGLRILTQKDKDSTITFQNYLRCDVIINKNLAEGSIPLISYIDEINLLFHLEDVMNHQNEVIIKIYSGGQSKCYSLKNYTTLMTSSDANPRVIKVDETYGVNLLAVPLNCPKEKIELIPIFKQADFYKIPEVSYSQQFIIISSNDSDARVLPRFVNVDIDYNANNRNERIEVFHQQMLETGFEADIWQELLSYYNICKKRHIPFSALDQIRAIGQSSEAAAKAFFYLGVNQHDRAAFIQQDITKLERDLGFCFHWIEKSHWSSAIHEAIPLVGQNYYLELLKLLSEYLDENNLKAIFPYLSNDGIKGAQPVLHPDINSLRMHLGEKVLNQLPKLEPRIKDHYSIPINGHKKVSLLINSAISVAESIAGVQEYSIWGGNDNQQLIRRNIQYSQYLTPKFYLKVILHVLEKL